MNTITCNNLAPTKNAIAVKLDEPPTSKGNLYLPEKRLTRDSVHVQATVKYIGENYEFKDDIAIGDKVIVSSNLGAICNINGEELRIYLSEDVVAKVG